MTQPRHNVHFPSGGGTAHGYLALPNGGSGPGVIVIQEWWGLTTHIISVADRLAAAGYVALAPDLYGGVTTHDPVEASRLKQELPVAGAVRDLTGAIDFLVQRDDVEGDVVGAVGFCMGGGFVLTLAASEPRRIGGAVAFYGLPPEDVELSQIAAPVMAHYAFDDHTIDVDDALKVIGRIRPAGQQVSVHLYPADHAFFNDENPRGNYVPELARVAWSRTLEFLESTLRQRP
jgi:carboxymethylenebutenolidase